MSLLRGSFCILTWLEELDAEALAVVDPGGETCTDESLGPADKSVATRPGNVVIAVMLVSELDAKFTPTGSVPFLPF